MQKYLVSDLHFPNPHCEARPSPCGGSPMIMFSEKIMKRGLDEQKVRCIVNWLNGWAQWMVISGMKSI